RRGRSPALRPRKPPCARDRRADATFRLHRLLRRRETTCRRRRGRARDRREIRAAGRRRRGCAPRSTRNVGERLFEQRAILETVADALLEGGRIAATALRGLWSLIGSGWTGRPAVGDWDGRLDGSWFACSPAAHLTIVNSRFQRTAHG